MKKIGIVGGVAWLSTVEYYSEFCRRSEERWLRSGRAGPPAYPEMTIDMCMTLPRLKRVKRVRYLLDIVKSC